MAFMLAMLLLVKASLPGFMHMQPRESTLGTIFSNAFVVCTATGFQYVTINQNDSGDPVTTVSHDCALCALTQDTDDLTITPSSMMMGYPSIVMKIIANQPVARRFYSPKSYHSHAPPIPMSSYGA